MNKICKINNGIGFIEIHPIIDWLHPLWVLSLYRGMDKYKKSFGMLKRDELNGGKKYFRAFLVEFWQSLDVFVGVSSAHMSTFYRNA